MNTPRLIRIFVEHRLASNLAMALMVLAGLWAITQINVQLNPEQPPRYISVSIGWRGAAAEDVEKLITTPVEQQLRTLGEIRTLRSYTGNGYTNVMARLEVGTDVGQAVEKIRQRVANMQSLPANIEPPQVAVSEWNELVASVLITGPKTTEEIAPLARRFERELLASGADKVEISGLPAEEIAIQVNSRTLYELGLSLDQLAERISRASQDAPGGRIGRGQEAQQLRSLGQRRSADEFADLIIFNDVNGRSMRLGDIATVTKRPRVDQPYTMMNGLPAVSLDVRRDVETDSLTAAEHLREWLGETEGKLTEGVSLQLFQEAWRYIADEITIILGNGLGGLMLVIVVLMVFLHGRVAFWVMVGIPVTFLAALLGFYYAGGTINLISIIGMVMALGIVVDDAIVVGEEALTQHQRGLSATDAAAAGASRMFAPVVASSITTLCAFAPIVVMAAAEGGGNIMEIPMVMLFMIGASLVECFLVLPGHLRASFEGMRQRTESAFRKRFDTAFARFREERFRPMVRLAMHNRLVVVGGAGSLFAVMMTLWVSGWIKTDPNLNLSPDVVSAQVQFAAGTPESEKLAYLGELEGVIAAADAAVGGDNVVAHVVSNNTAIIANDRKVGAQYASIQVEMVSEEKRSATVAEFALAWNERAPRSHVVDSLQVLERFSWNSDFSLLLKGEEVSDLKRASDELMERLATLDGVRNLHDNLPYGNDQLVFELTPEGQALGLSTAAVGSQLRAAYDGRRVQIFQDADAETEVRLTLPEVERADPASLARFPIRTSGGEMVPLSSVATWERRRGIEEIRHHDTQKTVAVSGDVDLGTITGGEVVAFATEEVIPELERKYGISYGLDGASLAAQEAQTQFLRSFFITLGLIFIVLAWVFSSYTWPLAVMAAIPLGLTGALAGHLLMGLPINPMSMMGLFALTGIIVNDSIILVTTFKNLRADGVEARQAIEDAVCARLRPVVVTSITTIAGLSFLMLEQAPVAAIYTPLAAAICFGLAYGTVLVLLVIPALLSAIVEAGDRAPLWVQRMLHPRKEPRRDAEAELLGEGAASRP